MVNLHAFADMVPVGKVDCSVEIHIGGCAHLAQYASLCLEELFCPISFIGSMIC